MGEMQISPIFFINNNMITFEQFFYESIKPHHRTIRRITQRGTDPENKMNIVANRYKKGDPNYKEKIEVGPISRVKLKELVGKYNLNISELYKSKNGVRLRKRPYKVIRTKTGFSIIKIRK
jgi:uncharacterized protein YqfB (UPF0267 family)